MLSAAVLDLDASLVDTYGGSQDWSEVEGDGRPKIKERLFTISPTGEHMFGSKRPHCLNFLKTCYAVFDIVGVWSAGSEPYVNEVTLELFKTMPRMPDFIWTKADCSQTYYEDTNVIVRQKPLEKLWFHFPNIDRKRTLLFDDMQDVCSQNPLNHILLPQWKGNMSAFHKDDDVLEVMSDWLQHDLKGVKDFRTVEPPKLGTGFYHF